MAAFDIIENDNHYPPSLICSQFPKIKLKLKGRYFESIEEMQAELQDVMKMLSQNSSGSDHGNPT
jgi:hypothetical protein